MMPVMNGWEFLRASREEGACAAVPIVVMSAARDASAVAAEFGAQGFLAKPFELDAVLAVIGKVVPAPASR